MLRQQQQVPPDDHNQLHNNLEELPEGSNEQGTEDDDEGNLMDHNHMQNQANTIDPHELANQQALMMQYQQQLQQPDELVFAQKSQSLRNRGRAKAVTQSGRQIGMAARIGGSASRSHGSRKRGQKTRSSLNVKNSVPLSGGIFMGAGPQSLSILPSNVGGKTSKKAAAQIYGNVSLLQNLTSQRKKSTSTSQAKKSLKGKRSQPNQGGAKYSKMQAQIQA